MKSPRTLIKSTLLLTVSIALSLVLLEAGVRWQYYSLHGPFQYATAHAIARLLEIFQVPGISGIDLNKSAWEASYVERGIPVPPKGPREGFWGLRIDPKNDASGLLGPYERAQFIPGLVEIDSGGFQHSGQRTSPSPHILIIGGSVAFGAYASSIDRTYFAQVQQKLSSQFPEVAISVFGRGSALSDDDLGAFALKGLDLKPDVVVFLNGLNDLVNPGTKPTHVRIREYLRNMAVARHIAAKHNLPIVFALQPFLGQKKHITPLERRILVLSGDDYKAQFNSAYEQMKEGLTKLADARERSYFIDCSGVCDEETATTFVDQWHFTDPGHDRLAEHLSAALVGILQTRR